MAIFALLALLVASAGALTLPSCTSIQYLDMSVLTCRACSTASTDGRMVRSCNRGCRRRPHSAHRLAQIPDAGNVDEQGNALSCTCPAGYLLSEALCASSTPAVCLPTCTACPSSQTTSLDRTRCMGCNTTSGATLDTSIMECVCPTGHMLIEATQVGAHWLWQPLGMATAGQHRATHTQCRLGARYLTRSAWPAPPGPRCSPWRPRRSLPTATPA